MSSAWTSADSLRVLNTGAATAGADQTDQQLSLGGYLSATFVKTMKYNPDSLPVNIEILYVSAANGEGTGTLAFSGAAVTWTAPGSSVGAAVTILTGETKIIEDGADPEKYVRISKISADEASQDATLALEWNENNAVTGDNADEALSLAGGFKYRSLGLSNGSSGAITGIKVYAGPVVAAVPSDNESLPATGLGELQSSEYVGVFPDDCHFAIYSNAGVLKEVVYGTRSTFGYDVSAANRGRCGTTATAGALTDTFAPVYGVELAVEAPTTDQITASVDEDTAPAAISFTGAFTEATAVTLASLAAGDWEGLHLKRDTPAGSVQTPSLFSSLQVVFTAGGTEYSVPFSSLYGVANAVQWQLFVSEDGTFDFTADPDSVSATLPINLPVTLPVSGEKVYWYVVRYRNRYGLTSLNQYSRKLSVDASGAPVVLAPGSPYDTTLADTYDGEVRVRTNYLKGNDDGFAANRWSIWASVGVDPDPDVDVAVKTKGIPDINLIGDGLELVYNIGPYDPGDDVRVVVRVYRSSDLVTDGNTDVIALITATGPDAPEDVTAIM